MSVLDTALYLEGGTLWLGRGFGARTVRGGEIVFNTGMTGYQEIYTDPSYCEQVVVLTPAEVGNTGTNPEDFESAGVHVSGVVVRNYSKRSSNWRATETLSHFLERAGVPGIFGVDTREITQSVREGGARRSVIFPLDGKTLAESPTAKAEIHRQGEAFLAKLPAMEGRELVSSVSSKSPYDFEPSGSSSGSALAVIYDYGLKRNIPRSLVKRGFRVRVVPYNFPHAEVLKMRPSAVVLSNGPGDPAAVKESNAILGGLIGEVPIFAVCMGHQLLARALGFSTYKLKFGHHGVNHPVKDLSTGRVLITSQNHGFAVDPKGFGEVVLSHQSLNDGCVEGFQSERLKLVSVQFHPEACPGPKDADGLFDHFVKRFVR